MKESVWSLKISNTDKTPQIHKTPLPQVFFAHFSNTRNNYTGLSHMDIGLKWVNLKTVIIGRKQMQHRK